jgi:hypothetical protein
MRPCRNSELAGRPLAVMSFTAMTVPKVVSSTVGSITGSGAFKNVPRAIFGFGRDPESADGGCVMTQSKNSLGRSGLPSISYRIESATVATPHGDAHTGLFVPVGVSDRSLTDILATANGGEKPNGDGAKLSAAQEFILTYVEAYSDDSGEVPSRDVITLGAREGHKANELTKARSAMSDRVGTRKTGPDRGWSWFLVQQDSNDAPVAA